MSAVLAFSVAQLQADTIYNAVNDFSLSGNPNGAWSYGTLEQCHGRDFRRTTIL